MCMEDFRIGRSQSALVSAVTVGVTATEVVPYSPNRVCLILGTSSAGRVTYSTEQGVTLDGGITVVQGTGALILNIQDHGELVRSRWYAIAAIAGQVGVAQSFLFRE